MAKELNYIIKVDTSEIDDIQKRLKDLDIDIKIDVNSDSIERIQKQLKSIGDVDVQLNIDYTEVERLRQRLASVGSSFNVNTGSIGSAATEASGMADTFSGLANVASTYYQRRETLSQEVLAKELSATQEVVTATDDINGVLEKGVKKLREIINQRELMRDLEDKLFAQESALLKLYKASTKSIEEGGDAMDEQVHVAEGLVDRTKQRLKEEDQLLVVLDRQATNLGVAEDKIIEIVNETDEAAKATGALADEAERAGEANEDAADSAGNVADEAERAKDATEEATKEATRLGRAYSGAKKMVVGIGSALKKAGIGVLLALTAAIGSKLSEQQPLIDAFNTSMNTVGIVVNDVVNYIQNNFFGVWDRFSSAIGSITFKGFAKAVKENITERIESALDMLGYLWEGLKQLATGDFSQAWTSYKKAAKESIDVVTGVNNTVDKVVATTEKLVEKSKEYVSSVFDQASAQTAANNAATIAVSTNKKLYEQYDRQAEVQRQLRDNIYGTYVSRIAASKELHNILQAQQALMISNADIAVDSAEKNRNANKGNIELEAKYQDALAEREGVLADVAGKESEFQVSHASLLEEYKQVYQDTTLAGLEFYSLDIAAATFAYEEKVRIAKLLGMETAAITEQYEKEKMAIWGKYAEAYVNVTNEAVGGVGNLFDALANGHGENAEKMFNITKALRYSETVINGLAGGIAIWTGPEDIYTKVAATIGLAANTAASLIKISQTEFGGGGSGSASGGGIVPQVNNSSPVTTGRALAELEVANSPTKAYVVHSELEIAAGVVEGISGGVTL